MDTQDSLLKKCRTDWFNELVGFSEDAAENVHDQIVIDGDRLYSKANNKTYRCGILEIASLESLRNKVSLLTNRNGSLSVRELVGDAKSLHANRSNQGSMFQVASQFNLLEMVSPEITPECGVGIYQNDPPQGPACAIACGAGTIFRNYFVPIDNQIGQSSTCQIDCLEAVGSMLGNNNEHLWRMKNGYALPSKQGLVEVNTKLETFSESQLNLLRSKVCVGVQWDTQVTADGCNHLVSQVYCSAVPVSYSRLPSSLWEQFGRLILEAAYEATFAAAAIQCSKTRNGNLFLTLLGGGAFGNQQQWILDAIERSCELYRQFNLNVMIVSHRKSNPAVTSLLKAMTRESADLQNQLVKASEETTSHYCPACGKQLQAFLRYPWYFCSDCVTLAKDTDGRRLQFCNASLSGGLQYKYADEPHAAYKKVGSVVCLIRGRRVIVSEARFGGIVAQPLTSDYFIAEKSPDLEDLSR